MLPQTDSTARLKTGSACCVSTEAVATSLLFAEQTCICGRVVFILFVKLSTLHLKYSLKNNTTSSRPFPKPLSRLNQPEPCVPLHFNSLAEEEDLGNDRGTLATGRWLRFFLAARTPPSPRRAQSIIRRAPSAKVLLRLARNFWGIVGASAPCHGAPFQSRKWRASEGGGPGTKPRDLCVRRRCGICGGEKKK